MATVQKLIDVQDTAQLDAQGQYTTIVNPDTGQREIAHWAVAADGQWIMVPRSFAQQIMQSEKGLAQGERDLLPIHMPPNASFDQSVVQASTSKSRGLGDFASDNMMGILATLGTAGISSWANAAAADALAARGAESAIAGTAEGAGAGWGFESLPAGGMGATGPGMFGGGVTGAGAGFGTLGGLAAGAGAAGAGAAGAGAAGSILSKLATGASVAGAGGSLANMLSKSTGLPEWLFDAAGRAIPGLLGAYAANEQGDKAAELANQQRASDDARFRDLLERDETRYKTALERENEAIARQRADYDAMIGRDTARYETALTRENEAIARQRGDIQFGRDVGQPSRDRYEGSYAPGFDITTEPALRTAMESTSDTLLRRLSANGGNPYGSPSALIEANKSVLGNVALPYLQNYRTQNAATGGYSSYGQEGAAVPGIGSTVPSGSSGNILGIGSNVPTGTNISASGGGPNQYDLASLNANTGMWGGLAGAAGDVFNPKPQQQSLPDLLKQLKDLGVFS